MLILKLLLEFSLFLFYTVNCDVLLTTIHNEMKSCFSSGIACDFDKDENNCVLSIIKRGSTSTYSSTCGKCPFQTGRSETNIICSRTTLKNPDYRRSQYTCCCSMPYCLDLIIADYKVGWEEKSDRVDCELAEYDTSKTPRWTDGDIIEQDHVFWKASRRYPLCHMHIKWPFMEDPRSGAKLLSVRLSLGYGCPHEPELHGLDTNHESYLISYNTSTVFCCYGSRCNTKLYRDLGFEILQNIAYSVDQQEYYRRIAFEMKNYKIFSNGTFVSATKKRLNLYPEYLIPMGILAMTYMVWKIKLVDIEKRPGKKSFIIVEREDEEDDFKEEYLIEKK